MIILPLHRLPTFQTLVLPMITSPASSSRQLSRSLYKVLRSPSSNTCAPPSHRLLSTTSTASFLRLTQLPFTRTLAANHFPPRPIAKLGSLASSPFSSSAPAKMPAEIQNEVEKEIKENFVMVFSKSYCPYCSATKKLLEESKSKFSGKSYKVIELDNRDDGSDMQNYLAQRNGQRTVPQVFINQEFIGGNSDLQALKGSKLDEKLAATPKN